MKSIFLKHVYVILAFIFSVAAASETPVDKVSQRPDGSSIYWTIDRQSGGAKQGILLVAQGSGCLAATENPNITNAKRLLPAFAVLTVEKYGVEPHAKPKDPFEGCSSVFYAHHTVSQRVADYERVLGELKQEPWWNGQLVLFGASEGGGAVSILAAIVNPTAVVIFSAAPGHSFGEIFKLSVPPEVAQQADDEFKRSKLILSVLRFGVETRIAGGRTSCIRIWQWTCLMPNPRSCWFKASGIPTRL